MLKLVGGKKISQIVEAILFSTGQAITAKEIASIVGTSDRKEIVAVILDLNNFYDRHKRAFFIHNIAGGYQLRVDAGYKNWIQKSKLVKPVQLSASSMETLSIISYNQPVTRAEIEELRAVDSSYSLRSLLDKKLVRITGKKDLPGRPLLYGTTSFFLEVFGFKSLSDLPKPEEADILINPDNEVQPADMEFSP